MTQEPARPARLPRRGRARQGLAEPDGLARRSRARCSCGTASTTSRSAFAGSRRWRSSMRSSSSGSRSSRSARRSRRSRARRRRAYEEAVAGTRTRSAPGTSSNVAGVVPTCSPSTSIGSAAGRRPRRARCAAPRPSGVHVPALVDLRRGRQEVELGDVADQHHVEDARRRASRPARASSRRRARRRSRRSRRASGRGARRRRASRSPRCSATRGTHASAHRRTSPCRRAPSTSRWPAARPRRSCRPSRRSRTSARLLAAPRAVADAAGVDRARVPSSATRTASSNLVGMP